MAIFSLLDKENIPINLPSVQPTVANPAVTSSKKRKSRTPLEDITNLLHPEFGPSSEDSQSEPDTSSLLLLARLAHQLGNRRKKARNSNYLRNSRPVSETLMKHFR
ncbi:60 kDa chaperonin 2 [Striga asiatica]|uniref:60 kDa chaperonin 2 n=1 Tax=Striga asiatica TaxID=4170 RepID=A0A5A7PFX8_STRAF|nr:60 kDa chaperonin 2 [Striga asiatica]